MAEIITKTALAKRIGVSGPRVTALIKRGLPVLKGGKIDFDIALAWLADNLDHSQKPGTSEAETLAALKRQHEMVKVNRSKLALRKERGELVDRKAVEQAIFARAKAERDSHLAWIMRVAPLIASEVEADTASLFASLDRHMRDHLRELEQMPLEALSHE